MERQRKTKLLSIMALVLAVFGMTLGFAAFSSVLNISSSANVKPDEDEFKIKIYGLNALYSEEEIANFNTSMVSDTMSVGQPWTGNYISVSGTATIDNSTLTIKNVNTLFEGNITGEEKIMYYFLIVNEGAYDAYIDTTSLTNVGKTCNGANGTSAELVAEACLGAELWLEFLSYDENGTLTGIGGIFSDKDKTISDNVKLSKGNAIVLVLTNYITVFKDDGSKRSQADGDWTVVYQDIEFDFSTAPPAN